MMVHNSGRPRNQLMKDQFSDIITLEMKCFQHKCNHCDHQSSKLAFREQTHLNQCQSYQKHQEEMKKKNPTIVAKKSNQIFIIFMIRFFSQTQLIQIHRANAMTVYMTNILFNHYEDFYVIESFNVLHSTYKFFSRKAITEKLLDEAYEAIKLQIMKRLNICNHFNFFTDETVNIRKKRVINFCCHVLSSNSFFEGEFQLKTITEFSENMNVAVQKN